MEHGLDSAVADFQNEADRRSSGTNLISDSEANGYIQAGADAAHAVNDAYNCVSGENTERAIGEMTDSINKANDDANAIIEENRKRAEAELRNLADNGQGLNQPENNQNIFYKIIDEAANCTSWATEIPFTKIWSGYDTKNPLPVGGSNIHSDSLLAGAYEFVKEYYGERRFVRVSGHNYTPKADEIMVAYRYNKSNHSKYHWIKRGQDGSWTHVPSVFDKSPTPVLKLKGNPWDYGQWIVYGIQDDIYQGIVKWHNEPKIYDSEIIYIVVYGRK